MTSRIEQVAGMAPTSGRERFEFLDVLRGFALFGIITANMVLYSLYLALPGSAKVAMPTHATDKVLDFLELAFIERKGKGVSPFFLHTAERERGQSFLLAYRRRER